MRAYQFNSMLARSPARSVVKGLRAVDRGNPSYELVKQEHAAYLQAMRSAGLRVSVLPALEEYPDSMFVEDTAVVFDDTAVLLRPGAPTRHAESALIAPTLHKMFRNLLQLAGEGSADGGDVLATPRGYFIGLSSRTDEIGARALQACLQERGFDARIVETPRNVLHLKSDCALLDEETILCTARLAGTGIFSGFKLLVVPDGEEPAANALRVNETVLLGREYPRTAELLDTLGWPLTLLATAQINRIDAGLSCMSLRWYAEG